MRPTHCSGVRGPVRAPLLALALWAVGCPSTQQAADPHAGTGPLVHRATGKVATHYGEAKPAELGGVEARILEVLAAAAQQAERPAPRADVAAQRVAREICLALPPKGPPSSAVVEFALRSHGLVDPPPHMVIAHLPPGLESEVLGQLGQRFAQILRSKAFSRVGIAVERPAQSPKWNRVLVALLESRVRFQPVPRVLAMGASVPLSFTADSTHRDIRLVVTSPDGTSAARPVGRSGSSLTARLACERRGVYQLEVTAEVLANFPVYCGQSPPSEVRYQPVQRLPERVEEMEQDLFAATNRVRDKHGLSRLRHNDALANVARAHSKDMMESGFVGHISPSTGRPVDRLRAAKVTHLVVRENVAQAYSTEEAMRELMNSPAHRENILSRDVTEVGIGIAVNREGPTPVLLVTQLFMRPGKPYNPATAEADVLAAIRRSRKQVGLGPLKVDEDLSRLATVYVRTLIEDDGKQVRADRALSAALGRLTGRFGRVDGLHVRVSVIDALEKAEEIQRKRYTNVGIGVGQLQGQVLIFLLLAGPG
jgi:uncharacterized protein YkwD